MDEFTSRLVKLHHCKSASWKIIYQLLKIDPMLNSISPNYSSVYTPIDFPLNHSQFKTIKEELHSNKIDEQIQQYKYDHIRIISIFDDEYPPLLKEIYEPPWILYTKGDLTLLKNATILAVVGSRESTAYSHQVIQHLFPQLIEKDVVIASGLAKGVDTLAHEGAIKYGGRTIAVIGGGFYHIYPESNKQLACSIMNQHLLISEYPPNTKPARWHFPMRNRIISGISRGTLIIQAKRRSGSLITANFAVQEGREVFAVPGSVLSPHSDGANELIQQGAKLIRNAEDIIEELVY